jgi:hypothetical protein
LIKTGVNNGKLANMMRNPLVNPGHLLWNLVTLLRPNKTCVSGQHVRQSRPVCIKIFSSSIYSFSTDSLIRQCHLANIRSTTASRMWNNRVE